MNDYRFWRTGTWELDHDVQRPGSTAQGRICFSPDSRIMAISHRSKGVRLIDPKTGGELPTLEDCGEQIPLAFSPDGSLLATQAQNSSPRVWDLCRVRAQLAEMGLDWGREPAQRAGI
jgi:WD40 repeat protein